jgi:hypothetical protein
VRRPLTTPPAGLASAHNTEEGPAGLAAAGPSTLSQVLVTQIDRGHDVIGRWCKDRPGREFTDARLGVVGSNADEVREVIEMLVSRVEPKVVLQYKSRQPHIVRRNRRALFPELAEHRSIVMSRLVVGKEHSHAVFQEETSQDPLVLGLPTPVREAGPKLADYDEGQKDRLSFLQDRHCLRDAFAQIDVSIGVESDPHRQRSSSTRS